MPQAAPLACGPKKEQERKGDIELLFDAKRPGMRERVIVGSRREIVVARTGENEIAQSEKRVKARPLVGVAQPTSRTEERAGDRGHDNKHQYGRPEPLD